jgi:hypothetical protein
VASEVRRSERLKVKKNGFKDTSCKTRDCFCCSIEPRTLSAKVIRNLGKDFCKISPIVMSDEALHKKHTSSNAVVSKQSKKAKKRKMSQMKISNKKEQEVTRINSSYAIAKSQNPQVTTRRMQKKA